MPDPTPAEQVRAEAIERAALWLAQRDLCRCEPAMHVHPASSLVDAIADLLRTGIDPDTIADEFGIQGLEVVDGAATLTTMPTSEQARELVLAMSLACGRMLDDDQAPNYVEFEVSAANRPGYVVHVRRAEGPTPHTLRRKAEARWEDCRQRMAAAEADLLEVRGVLSPQGYPRRIPDSVDISQSVVPAIEWLVARIAELERAPEAAGEPSGTAAAEQPTCDTFAWIGQSFAHCDDCGRPFWEHAYEHTSNDSAFGEPGKRLITDEKKAACRARWGGPDA